MLEHCIQYRYFFSIFLHSEVELYFTKNMKNMKCTVVQPSHVLKIHKNKELHSATLNQKGALTHLPTPLKS
jgi:hypothetical protein